MWSTPFPFEVLRACKGFPARAANFFGNFFSYSGVKDNSMSEPDLFLPCLYAPR